MDILAGGEKKRKKELGNSGSRSLNFFKKKKLHQLKKKKIGYAKIPKYESNSL